MILHVYRGDSSISNRVTSQLEIDKGEVLDKVNYFSTYRMYKIARERNYKAVIFHQHRMLYNLVAFFFFSKFSNVKCRVVFDIHDLNEIGNIKKGNGRIKSFFSFFVSYFLEKIVSMLDVRLVTVSCGIKKILEEKYRKKVTVIYSLPSFSYERIRTKSGVGDRTSLVYFGVINQNRLPIDVLKKLTKCGYTIDIWGYYSATTENFVFELEKLYAEGKVVYKGEYYPKTINEHLCKYAASLMIFRSRSKNIRYCLPNKLFQSLQAGVPCIVSSNLEEVSNLEFSKDWIIKLDTFLNKGLNSNIKYEHLTYKLSDLEKKNRENYMKLICDNAV